MKNTLVSAIALTTILSGTALANVPPAPAYSENVASVQTILSSFGYYNAPINGMLDSGTRAAVAAFQSSYGMPATGVVDAATANSLNDYYASLAQTGGASAPVADSAEYSSNVMSIQRILNTLGFLQIPANGYMDAQTRQAIAKFQTANHLLVNGEVDTVTASALNNAYQTGGAYQYSGVKRSSNEPYVKDDSIYHKYRWLWAGAGVAAVAGGAALATGGGGGGSSGGSSQITFNIAANDSGNETLDNGFAATDFNNPANDLAATFLTAETANNEGVADLNANYAWARGYDGRVYNRDSTGALKNNTFDSYVIVATVDSGVDSDHPDLVGNLLLNYAVSCTAAGCTSGAEDEEGHGTEVAGIIAAERNGFGTTGIAPQAKILPLKNDLSTAGTLLNYAYGNTKGVAIYNNSYGFSTPIVTPTTAGTLDVAITPTELRTFLTTSVQGNTFLSAFQQAVAQDILFVWAAGNESGSESDFLASLPYYFAGTANAVNVEGYDWSKNWVNVISVDDSNVISSFSNQCGITQEWCLAASGEIKSTTAMGGGYTGFDSGTGFDDASGTSFAAPNVSGALAILLGAYPQLTPEKALQILFETATDLGAPGADLVYGRGLVNLDAATTPSNGGWTIALAGITPQSTSFTGTGINLSGAFGDAMTRNSQNFIFLDRYNKDYTIPLNSVTARAALTKTADERLAEFSAPQFANTAQMDGTFNLGFTLADNGQSVLRKSAALTGDENSNKNKSKLALQYSIASSADSSFDTFLSYNVNAANELGFSALADVSKNQVLQNDAFKNPYLAIADSSTGTASQYKFDDMAVKFAVFDGETERQNYQFADSNNVSGYMSELSFASPHDDLAVSVQTGMNTESGTFLGSEAGGALALADGAQTYYTGVAASYSPFNDFYLNANYNYGVTNLSPSANSLISNVSDIKSNSFAVGAELHNLYDNGDRFGVTFSQPLRVTSGSGTVTLPQDVNADGSLVYQTSKLALNPQGQEMDIQAFYDMRVAGASGLSLGSMLRLEPDNVQNAANEGLFLLRYTAGF